MIDQLHARKADIAICTEKVDEIPDLVIENCYTWHHALVVPPQHPLSQGDISLERLAQFPILTYNLGYTGRSNIESALRNKGLEIDVVLAAADSDVIKTYVRLGLGADLISGMAYDPLTDMDLISRNLSHLIPSSRTKIAYLKHNYLPLYTQHFIEELQLAAKKNNLLK